MSVPSDSKLWDDPVMKEALAAFTKELEQQAQEWTDEVEQAIRSNTQSVTESVRRLLSEGR
jgi:hypothetical protein